MDKEKHEKKFFSAIKKNQQFMKPKDKKTMVLIVLKKIIFAFKQETEYLEQKGKDIDSLNLVEEKKKLTKQIKHLIESFDIVFDSLSENEQKVINDIKEENNYTDVFNKVSDLCKIVGINKDFLECKSELFNKINDLESKILEQLKKKNNAILSSIVDEIKIANQKIKLDNAQEIDAQKIASELKESIIGKLKKISNDNNQPMIGEMQASSTSIASVLNEYLLNFFYEDDDTLENYIKCKDQFMIDFIKATAKNFENGLKKDLFDFVTDEKNQTIDKAKQIFETIIKEYEEKSSVKLTDNQKAMSSSNVRNLLTDWQTKINDKISKLDQKKPPNASGNIFGFLKNQYATIVEKLEIKSEFKYLEDLIEKLSNNKFPKNDIKKTNFTFNLLKQNCQKYIIKAKKHFGVIKKTNMDTNKYNHDYKIKSVKNENLRDVLNNLISSCNQVFSEDIKQKSIEKWKEFYKSSIEKPIEAIINNIKKKNKNLKINASDFEIKFTDEEKKRIEEKEK